MIAVLAALRLLAWSADPSTSALVAVKLGARVAGHTDLADEVGRYCKVESAGCRRVGVHTGHGNAPGSVFWPRAVRVGWLSPASCPVHARGGGDAFGWGSSGPLGLVAAYHVRELGDCVSPAAVLDPLLAGWLAARALARLRARGFCDERARRVAYRDGAQSMGARVELLRCR